MTYLTDCVDLTNWKGWKDIQVELACKGVKISERTWRKEVAEQRKRFTDHEEATCIASCNLGYKRTADGDEIVSSAWNKIRTAASMIKNARKELEAHGENVNLQMYFGEQDEGSL